MDGFTQMTVSVLAKPGMSTVTEEDTRRLIELRAANEALFTGKRNTAKPAWRSAGFLLNITEW